MAETYDILCDGSPVGTAKAEKQGLYYCFSCRCRLPDEGLYRIHVISGEKREDLGICVPVDGMFGMDKKLPAKRLGEGVPGFVLLPKDWKPQPVTTQQTAVTEEKTEENDTLPETETAITESAEDRLAFEPEPETFIPVSEEEPFDHLDKLEDAVMEVRDGQAGIVLQKQE